MVAAKLSVLTLNCWGIPIPGLGSKDREQRMKAIADKIAEGMHDIVMLQEIWDEKDFKSIQLRVSSVLPYSHYFHSGFVGSGVCVFSKGEIVEAFNHRYYLNGYAHKIWHGDWFGGKLVGMNKIVYQGLEIALYTTHVHAEYCRDNDEYLAHRVSQAYELSQFIKHTSGGSDLVILGGDLNYEPVDIGYRIVRTNANMLDAWLEKKEWNADDEGYTCDVPSNCYTSKACLKLAPKGKRIDYIMFKSKSGVVMTCDRCYTTLGHIPNTKINYSDHEALAADFTIHKSSKDSPGATSPGYDKEQLLREAVHALDRGMDKVKQDKKIWILVGAICIALLFVTAEFNADIGYGIHTAIILLRVALVLAMGFCGWMAFIMDTVEMKGLIESRQSILYVMKK
ncbi:putative neutral sphingomyelinase [Lingula anatina]|uniref:sphingomyelin phosphodiesterase n=1 Tax=Lingula anatina TaxID=7574 RepID=A0A1S3K2U5_LINAN|nr:putative neutral sphingomyelinase [Lingula anatina]|eukprot:XP_013416724.1 putative neutral sphingomyelinase [Lingula anatina]